jgi:hypothetical protein
MQLLSFAESWNKHRMQMHSGPNQSPEDMFGSEMLQVVHGVQDDIKFMTVEELLVEIFGSLL